LTIKKFKDFFHKNLATLKQQNPEQWLGLLFHNSLITNPWLKGDDCRYQPLASFCAYPEEQVSSGAYPEKRVCIFNFFTCTLYLLLSAN